VQVKRFQVVDVSFDGAVTPWRRYRELHRFRIAAQRTRELSQKPECSDGNTAGTGLGTTGRGRSWFLSGTHLKLQFEQLLEAKAADIVQPDICLAGGIVEERSLPRSVNRSM
jgi:hypothetical protein